MFKSSSQQTLKSTVCLLTVSSRPRNL